MRRISFKSRKGKGAANDTKDSAADAETQGNGSPASSEDEEVLGEKKTPNQGKKNKRGRKTPATKHEDASDETEEPSEDEEVLGEKKTPNQGKKNKRGRKTPVTKHEDASDETEESDGEPIFDLKARKGKKGRKGNDRDVDNDPEKLKKHLSDEEEKEEGESYEVEKIIDCRIYRGTKQFRIRWKGYEEDRDTWELETNVNCPDLVEAFLAENPDAFKKSNKQTGKADPRKHKKPANSAQPKVKKPKVGADPEHGEDGEKVYEVERVVEVHFKKNGEREFLIRWKGFTSEDDTWEPEANLNCPELIEKFMQKVNKAREVTERELRVNPQVTNRFTLATQAKSRRLSNRHQSRQRATYYNTE